MIADLAETEIGKIPQNWKVARLGNVAKTASGGTPSRSIPNFFVGSIPWVKSGELEDTIVMYTEEMISKAALDSSSAKIFPTGTLLVAMYGATVGKTALLGIPASTNQAVCAIFPDENILNSPFLRYFLIHIRPSLLKERFGGAQPNISQQIIQNTLVAIPPLPEQLAIAAVLSKIQAAVEVQDKFVATLKELKAATMAKLFREGLRGEPLKQTEIGEVPESWVIKRFGDFATLQRGYDLPVHQRSSGNVPVIGSNGVVGYHDKTMVKGPGVCTGRSGTMGLSFYCETDFWPLNTALFVVDFHGNDPLFVHYFFECFDFQQFAAGVSVPTLNRNLVHEAVIAVPLPEDQTRMARTLRDIDTAITLAEKRRTTLKFLFLSMLHLLMTGRVRVTGLIQVKG